MPSHKVLCMNTPSTWFSRRMSRLLAPASATAAAADATASSTPDASAPPRTTQERLQATLRRGNEALAPRALRRLLAELQAIADPLMSDIEAGKYAQAIAHWYDRATPEARYDMWLLLCEQFAPDAQQLSSAYERYTTASATTDRLRAEMQLRRAMTSPRTRLLQRCAVFPQGVRFLVDLRAELLPHLRKDPRLQALDAELEHLFASWFDVAFLELRRLSWDSPASLLEKLIRYEAVHDIRSWADLKNRLDSDRRCYGFFHPRLPDEPLIFVEVALVRDISTSITPLLDESAAHQDIAQAQTAIFYSISNTQTGLRGVSFGNSLIKHVVETLSAEFPRLRTFATLSPIPGFRHWLSSNAARMLEQVDEKALLELQRALDLPTLDTAQFLQAAEQALDPQAPAPLRQMLMLCAAHYLGQTLVHGKPADPVARFHLSNGARIEQLNWAADPSSKGMKQSYGLMVNYLYDLQRMDRHRTELSQGQIPMSKKLQVLLRN